MSTTIEIELENYGLIEELSQDNVVTVYRGYRKADQAPVIIKVLSPLFASDEFLVRRFKLAAQQTAKLEHPHIINTYEAEQDGDRLYLVQDFVEARPLAQVLAEEGSFALQRMQMVARQLASALDYAHQKSVTHGNLSASRVFLGPDDHVWVADFGQTQALFGVNLMKQSYAVSAPETMAPERVHGQGPSRQSDLYALGILCYQMLAARPPFVGSTSAVLHAQAYQQPRPLYRLNPGIPVAVSEVVGRMLSKGLELRYNTGAEFARALAAACNLPKGFSTHGFQQPDKPGGLFSTKWVRNISGVVMLIGAAALVLAGYQLGVSRQANQGGAAAALINSPGPATLQEAHSLPAVSNLAVADESTALVVTATPTLGRMRISDTLPTPTYTPIGQREPSFIPHFNPVLAAPTPTATPVPPTSPPVGQPAAVKPEAEPNIPTGKGLLIFYNPTGHDLVVDLTGPNSVSKLVPPDGRVELVLSPGRYQCVIHTPTGQWLSSRVLEFDVFEGQAVEKDYYTDYDTQSAQLNNN